MARGRKPRTLDVMTVAAELANEHLNGPDDSETYSESATEGVDYSEGDDPPPLNSAGRADIIREAHETITEYENQIVGLKAEIKAVVETRVVASLGMKKRDFAFARKLLGLDQGERDTLQESIREVFSALGVGMQLNWLDAAEREKHERFGV
jgi:hypothetical protein